MNHNKEKMVKLLLKDKTVNVLINDMLKGDNVAQNALEDKMREVDIDENYITYFIENIKFEEQIP